MLPAKLDTMDCPRESEVADFFAGHASPELRRRLEAHLARCSSCLAVIAALQRERSDASLDSTLGASTLGAASDRQTPALGAALGHFILLERLGQGAMGTVNVAYDRRLDRKVAIKLVRGEKVADPLSRARMLREARAMAKITHPHVVAVHEANEYEDGVYVVMELVRGSTLRAWLAAVPRPSGGPPRPLSPGRAWPPRRTPPASSTATSSPSIADSLRPPRSPPTGRIPTNWGDLRGSACSGLPPVAPPCPKFWQRAGNGWAPAVGALGRPRCDSNQFSSSASTERTQPPPLPTARKQARRSFHQFS
ncbi:protein kinase [Nannocystis sp.]|uniref:protein kinase domain-containing protein n=1 Tax=Nannocystis sp. TaxID=1962667 RepID=UPI00344C2805|nr:protein kinase [Nannocystis sp.]